MKGTVISIGIAGALIIGSIFIVGQRGQSRGSDVSANNVSVINGAQIVEIMARGGYYPGISQAKAGVPTVLRMKTNGSYDCSSAVSIPSLGVFKNLPASGSTDIEIPAQSAGTRFLGTCAMGMYRFEVDFSS